MRNVEEANHILYGCIFMGSNPILTSINRKPLRVSIVKRLEGSYWYKDRMNMVIAANVFGLCVRWGFPALKLNSSNKLNLNTNDK